MSPLAAGTYAALASRGFGEFLTTGAEGYFFTTCPTLYFYDVKSDSQGNYYAQGLAWTSFVNETVGNAVVKFDKYGTPLWQKVFAQTPENIFVDNDGYLYTNDFKLAVTKAQSDGTAVWRMSINYDGTIAIGFLRIADWLVDGGQNLYIGTERGRLVRFDSAGAQQWSKQITLPSATFAIKAIKKVGARLYVLGDGSDGDMRLMRFDASGALTWSKQISVSGQTCSAYDLNADTDKKLYVSFSADQNYYMKLTDTDTTATIDWQKKTATGPVHLQLDASGNLFGNIATESGVHFITLNQSTGGAVLKRVLTRTTGTDKAYKDTGVDVYEYSSAAFLASNSRFVARLPEDGSKTGTYSAGGFTITWANDTGFSASNGSAAISGSSPTIASATFPTSTTTSVSPNYTTSHVLSRTRI